MKLTVTIEFGMRDRKQVIELLEKLPSDVQVY